MNHNDTQGWGWFASLAFTFVTQSLIWIPLFIWGPHS